MKRQRIRRKILVLFFLLLPIVLNYFSPYLMTEGTALRVATASLFVWGLYFLSALFVGRAACGWFCPFQGLQLLWEKIADKPLKEVRYLRAVKYVLWAVWVGGVAAVAISVGGWQRIDLLYKTPLGISVDSVGSLITYYTLVGITLLPMALGRRGFCQYFCPFSGYMIVGAKLGQLLRLPQLHLAADASKCTSCGKCDRDCPMSLRMQEMVTARPAARTATLAEPRIGGAEPRVVGAKARTPGARRSLPMPTECILCGTCVDGCKRGAVSYTFGRVPSRDGRRTDVGSARVSPLATRRSDAA